MNPLKYWQLFLSLLFGSLLFILPLNLYSQEFAIPESYIIEDICSCDLDLDGDLDLVLSAHSYFLPDSIYIFYNDGSGNLNKSSICRSTGIFIRTGCIDDDQYPDIITKDGSSILFIKNNGDGTFGEEIIIAPSKGNRVIEYIADMDGDGLNDLVYTYNAYYCKWGILRNEGDLLFSDHIIYSDASGSSLSPLIGNLNNDNLPDACFEYTTEGIHVLNNNGDLTFDSLLLCSTKGYAGICNLDLNPPQDILVFAPNDDQLIFYENMGNNLFSVRNTLPLINGMAPFVADFNNDGYDDLGYTICFWTGYTDSIYIRMNDQNWNFLEPQQYYAAPLVMFIAETVDLNGDNFNDIIMSGYTPRNAFKVLWNDGSGGFSYENPVGVREYDKVNNNLQILSNPNPFISTLYISIKAANKSQLHISILDLFGQTVKGYNPSTINTEGNLELTWDGKDNSDNGLPAGIYFLMITENEKISHIMKIIKY